MKTYGKLLVEQTIDFSLAFHARKALKAVRDDLQRKMGLPRWACPGMAGMFGAFVDDFEQERRQSIAELGANGRFNRVGHPRLEEEKPSVCQVLRFLVFYQSVAIIRL